MNLLIRNISTTAIILFFSLNNLVAEIKLPAIVSSNMVLQRNTDVNIWGWAKANEKIEISFSWIEKSKTIEANKDGYWSVLVKTTNTKEAQSIQLKSKYSSIVLENILFGEVWFCSGQSNMQQPIKGFVGQPTFESQEAILNANNPNLRLFTIHRKASLQPLDDITKFTGWQEASPNTIGDFSAVAYFYGQQLQQILNVPVGLIHTSWGGSRIEAWMSADVLSYYQTIDLSNINLEKQPQKKPTVLFNAMIHPIVNYTIKGALWYQGEANRAQPELYKKLFPAMVSDWRQKFKSGQFPFYYVQIASFSYEKNKPKNQRVNTAYFREAQFQCLDIIQNSGIAITIDIGSKNSIHPPKKKEVAQRLLFNALHKTYGYTNIPYSSPVYDVFVTNQNQITLSFKNNKSGLFAQNNMLKGFEIAGEDKIFYPAEAKIVKGKKIVVKSDKVLKPIAVRYAWKNWFKGSLFGGNLLPVPSFRTDNW